MSPMLISAAVGVLVFLAASFIIPGLTGKKSNLRKKKVLSRIGDESKMTYDYSSGTFVEQQTFKDDGPSPIDKLFAQLPGVTKLHTLSVKAGFKTSETMLVLGVIVLGVFLSVAINTYFSLGFLGALLGFAASAMGFRKYFRRRIRKRNDTFINMFPDAIDMIVRSVRSGHPINTAFRMIAENTDPPVSTEFKQVVDEISYGRTLVEAVSRLGLRIDEPDINFFIVVLVVQQETGGNLAEVLSNLSNIIRKRKQLRLKIRAMTSEGRITAWILGSLPFVVMTVLHFVSPDYLDPLFEPGAGRFILACGVGMIGLCFFIVNKMVQIDV